MPVREILLTTGSRTNAKTHERKRSTNKSVNKFKNDPKMDRRCQPKATIPKIVKILNGK
jgi:hypothetical protein